MDKDEINDVKRQRLGNYIDEKISSEVISSSQVDHDNSRKYDQQITLNTSSEDYHSFLDREKCCVCSSIEVDEEMRANYGVNVCPNCRIKYPARFGLIVKTEAREVKCCCG